MTFLTDLLSGALALVLCLGILRLTFRGRGRRRNRGRRSVLLMQGRDARWDERHKRRWSERQRRGEERR